MLINSAPNLVLFHPGYLRLTIDEYSEEDLEDEKNLHIHLTNNALQHKHAQYKEKKENSVAQWTDI